MIKQDMHAMFFSFLVSWYIVSCQKYFLWKAKAEKRKTFGKLNTHVPKWKFKQRLELLVS